MEFKLEKMNMDLGDTPIENIFINDYLPQADGNFVKVYLLGLKLAREPEGVASFDFGRLADLLGLIESDIRRAFEYWERAGVVKRELNQDGSFDIVFVNLKQLYVENVYTKPEPKQSSRSSVLDDNDIARLLSTADYYMRGMLTNSKKLDIASWRETYNMPVEMIEEAFWYSTEIKKKESVDYVEAVVRNWSRDNIRTKEDIEKASREHDEKFYRLMKVKERIGLANRAYKQVDFEKVNSWFDEYKFSMELVMTACDRTVNTSNPNIGYVDRILMNWREKGITEVSEIAQKDVKRKIAKRTKFHNFTQATDKMSEDEMENLARKKREDFYKKLG